MATWACTKLTAGPPPPPPFPLPLRSPPPAPLKNHDRCLPHPYSVPPGAASRRRGLPPRPHRLTPRRVLQILQRRLTGIRIPYVIYRGADGEGQAIRRVGKRERTRIPPGRRRRARRGLQHPGRVQGRTTFVSGYVGHDSAGSEGDGCNGTVHGELPVTPSFLFSFMSPRPPSHPWRQPRS